MRVSCADRSHDAGSHTEVESAQTPSKKGNTFGAPAYHVVSEKHHAEKEWPTRAEETLTLCKTSLKNATAGSSGLTESNVTALVTLEGHNRIAKTDIRLQVIRQGLFNKITVEKYIFRVWKPSPPKI